MQLPTFLHLDRQKKLRTGQTITLKDLAIPDGFEHGLIPELESVAELRTHARYLFPDGVLRHGTGHMLHDSREGIIESFFEYVRRAGYPDRPSRFQSVFAFDGPQALMEFAKTHQGMGDLWEVRADTFFRADMSWLTVQGALMQWSYRADSYWQGKSSEIPQWEYLLEPPVTVVGYRGILDLCLREVTVPPPGR